MIRLLERSTAEDNRIKESELQSIVKSMESLSAKQAEVTVHKQPAKVHKEEKKETQTKSLSDKIREQKEKLKQSGVGKKESKVHPAKRSPILTRNPVPRSNYHRTGMPVPKLNLNRRNIVGKTDTEAGQERPEELVTHHKSSKNAERQRKPVVSPVHKPAVGYSKRHENKIRQLQHEEAEVQGQNEEPCFDQDDYTKTATAFNHSLSLSQSMFQRAVSAANRGCPEDVSFTERLLVENSMVNVAKRKGMQIPTRALSTEERAFSRCTFKPDMFKSPQKYTNIQPRLLSHLEQPTTETKKVPKTEQVLSTLNRSYQSTVLDSAGTYKGGQRQPINRRTLCIS